jgi:uncharacterized protein (UPF0254 family)
MNVFSELPICILSPDVPFKVGLFAQMSCPSVSLIDTTINIFIPEPVNVFNDKVLAYVKKQKQEIIDQIDRFETQTFKVVSSSKDADFTFIINTLIRKNKGKLVRIPRIKWVMAKRSKKIKRMGLYGINTLGIKIGKICINSDKNLRRRVGSFSEILEAPGFQTAVAKYLIYKNVVISVACSSKTFKI